MAAPTRLVLYHHNFALAIARGFASETEHAYPYVDAFAFGDVDACRALWDNHCYEPVAVMQISQPASEDHTLKMMEVLYDQTQHGNPKFMGTNGAWNQLGPEDKPLLRIGTINALHRTDNRSTMVGDVIEVIEQFEKCIYVASYIVQAVGFVIFEPKKRILKPVEKKDLSPTEAAALRSMTSTEGVDDDTAFDEIITDIERQAADGEHTGEDFKSR